MQVSNFCLCLFQSRYISIELFPRTFVAVSRLYQVYLDALAVEIDDRKWRDVVHPKYWFLLSLGPYGYNIKVKKKISEFDLRKSIELFLRHPTIGTELSESNYTQFLLSQAMSVHWIALILNPLKEVFNQRDDYGAQWINPFLDILPMDTAATGQVHSCNGILPRSRLSTVRNLSASQSNKKNTGIPSTSDNNNSVKKEYEVPYEHEEKDIDSTTVAPSVKEYYRVNQHVQHPSDVGVAQSLEVSMPRIEAVNEDDNAKNHRRDDAFTRVKIEPSRNVNFYALDVAADGTKDDSVSGNYGCSATAKDEISTDEEEEVLFSQIHKSMDSKNSQL